MTLSCVLRNVRSFLDPDSHTDTQTQTSYIIISIYNKFEAIQGRHSRLSTIAPAASCPISAINYVTSNCLLNPIENDLIPP